ncbi:hypothetical protein [Adhaeribacter rhizoryzae]|uniref:Uncharacterized protein n=1 Tax=Adhaeribacter rhizoryzae TaxID=2607907 RepID=A0A5M6D4B4_9BACT|nr:hypothetical protein [Adhaeribacter rhizoryzae]KAA5541686.1 hypothetical protein F0145_20165 [Adhaeribacter rhizoryzae]
MDYIPERQSKKAINRNQLVNITAQIICIFGISHVLLGLLLFYINLPLFQRYIAEDGYIEYLTAFFLLFTSFTCLYKAFHTRNKIAVAFFCLAALLFFFGFGEEISWGQRVLGFETPEKIKMANSQQEFNLHNLKVGEVKLNKLIFGVFMYFSLFVYFLVFNILYKNIAWFRKIINITGLPLPAPTYSICFVVSFLLVLLIQNSWKWELDEFAMACFVFLSFYRPYNRKLQHPEPL